MFYLHEIGRLTLKLKNERKKLRIDDYFEKTSYSQKQKVWPTIIKLDPKILVLNTPRLKEEQLKDIKYSPEEMSVDEKVNFTRNTGNLTP